MVDVVGDDRVVGREDVARLAGDRRAAAAVGVAALPAEAELQAAAITACPLADLAVELLAQALLARERGRRDVGRAQGRDRARVRARAPEAAGVGRGDLHEHAEALVAELDRVRVAVAHRVAAGAVGAAAQPAIVELQVAVMRHPMTGVGGHRLADLGRAARARALEVVRVVVDQPGLLAGDRRVAGRVARGDDDADAQLGVGLGGRVAGGSGVRDVAAGDGAALPLVRERRRVRPCSRVGGQPLAERRRARDARRDRELGRRQAGDGVHRRSGAAAAAIVDRADAVAQRLSGVPGRHRVVGVEVVHGDTTGPVELAALPLVGERDRLRAGPRPDVAGQLVAHRVAAADARRDRRAGRDGGLEHERQRLVLLAHRKRRGVHAIETGGRPVVLEHVVTGGDVEERRRPIVVGVARLVEALVVAGHAHPPTRTGRAGGDDAQTRRRLMAAHARLGRAGAQLHREIGSAVVARGRPVFVHVEGPGEQPIDDDKAVRGAVVAVTTVLRVLRASRAIATAGDRRARSILLLDPDRPEHVVGVSGRGGDSEHERQ